MSKGLVAMKQKYLGHAYPGQDLNWCRIDIGTNAVAVYVWKGGVERCTRFVTDEPSLSILKAKLRSFVRGKLGASGWSVEPGIHPKSARLFIWYPSLSRVYQYREVTLRGVVPQDWL